MICDIYIMENVSYFLILRNNNNYENIEYIMVIFILLDHSMLTNFYW